MVQKEKRDLKYVNLEGAPELSRWIGGAKGGNRVLGGLVLHQTRRGMSTDACKATFHHLSSECAQERFFDRWGTLLLASASQLWCLSFFALVYVIYRVCNG